jgi:hydroxyacylglutathione hydrolase
VEPGNADVHARIAREQAKRDRDEPTLPSTIGDEHATNPFLRAALPAVAERAADHAGRRMNDAVDTFATLREWKNAFG